MTQEFQEYPKWMAHPHAQKSVPVQQPSEYQVPNALFKGNVIGTPEKFAPVMVVNTDEEAQYAAKGYEPAGKQNPWAFDQAVTAPQDPAYVPQEYPKWVNGKLCESAEEERAISSDASQRHLTVQEQDALHASLRASTTIVAKGKKPHPLKGKKLGPRKPKVSTEPTPEASA